MPSQSMVLTIPSALEKTEPYLRTGYEYVSLPIISPENGAFAV